MTRECRYPDCDGGATTGLCHQDCHRALITKGLALKAAIKEIIGRTFQDDPRTADITFGLALTVLAETTAELISAIAENQEHAERLLEIWNRRAHSLIQFECGTK